MNKGKIKLVLTFLLVVLAISITAAYSKPTVNKTYKGYEEFLILHDETIPLEELHSDPPPYFRCKYAPTNVYGAEGQLPDFGNKSAEEAFRERCVVINTL